MSKQCPKCKATVEDGPDYAPSRGAAMKAVFFDWRIWVVGLAVNMVVGMLVGGLDLPRSLTAAGGGALGMYCALRFTQVRKCKQCSAVAVPTAS
jgi:hypothetical protein